VLANSKLEEEKPMKSIQQVQNCNCCKFVSDRSKEMLKSSSGNRNEVRKEESNEPD
jgi:hypothetical protein